MSQLKPTTSSVYITMPLGGELDIWTIMSFHKTSWILCTLRSARTAALAESFCRESGNCIGRENMAECCTYIHSNERHRNSLSFSWRRSIDRVGLSWSVAGEEHTPAVTVGVREENSFHHGRERTVRPQGDRDWITNIFSNKFTWVNWNSTAELKSST